MVQAAKISITGTQRMEGVEPETLGLVTEGSYCYEPGLAIVSYVESEMKMCIRDSNWWCVIFPSLCVPATADGFAEAAAAGGFSTGEIRLLTQADPAYTVKFRSLELLQALKSRLFGEE